MLLKFLKTNRRRKQSQKMANRVIVLLEQFKADIAPKVATDRLEEFSNHELQFLKMDGFWKEYNGALDEIASEVTDGAITCGYELDTFLYPEDNKRVKSVVDAVHDTIFNYKRTAISMWEKRVESRKKQKAHDDPLVAKYRSALKTAESKVSKNRTFWWSYNKVHGRISDLEEAVADAQNVMGEIQEVLEQGYSNLVIDSNWERIKTDGVRLAEKVHRFHELNKNYLNDMVVLREAILSEDYEAVRRLALYKCPMVQAKGVEVLVHGISPKRPGENGSWVHKAWFPLSNAIAYTPEEYVDVLEDVLSKGLKSSKRNQREVDEDHPGVYFFDEKAQCGIYGMLLVKTRTEDFKQPVFDVNGGEFVVYGERLKSDFELELHGYPDLMRISIKTDDGFIPYPKAVRRELDKRGITYTIHESYSKMLKEAYHQAA